MLLGTGVAEAQVAEEQSAPDAPGVTFGDAVPVPDIKQRLDEAVRAYQVGQREEARRLLVDLVLAPPPGDPTLLLEARIYLGELLYTEGDEEGARRFFEQVLQIDPLYIIDPFRHPPDITSFFD
jgi:class 3 adenylate cyclase